MAVRMNEWAQHFNLRIVPIQDRPDAPGSDSEIVYVIRDVFTTRDGSWEPSTAAGSVPGWARAKYLTAGNAPDHFDDAGGDHHIFARVLDVEGKPIPDAPIMYWSDGIQKLADPNYTGFVHRTTKTRSAWGNIPISSGSSFVPERGESGPWCWCPSDAPSEVIAGGGMPAKWHVSTFVVWQAVRRSEWEGAGSGDGATEEPSPPVHPTPVPPVIATPPVEPTPPSAVYPAGEAGIRQSAWDAVGVNYNPEAAFSNYAREKGLGIPLANEYTVNDYLAQPFVGGIVFARKGDWGNIQHISW